MSKNLDEAKLRRMVNKYRKYKEKRGQDKPESTSQHILKGILEKCEQIWCKIVPPSVRDYRGEFELFNHYWQRQIGKPCSNLMISRLSLDQNLKAYKPGMPIVLGLVYNPQSMQKIANFINYLRVNELKNEVILCPINTQGNTYRYQIEPKIILFEQTIAIFWKGLFDEMILLNKFRMQDVDLLKTVKSQVGARIQYEGRIREAAEGQKFCESYSKVLM